MAQSQMYPAIANSPGTELSADISEAVTTIPVLDANKLPAAPNLFTVGSDETAETVQYTGKSGNSLTGCTRGFNGTTAKGWSTGAKVARNFTAYDHDTFRGNIADLDTRVTAAKAKADAAETPAGAQEKADKAQQAAEEYADGVQENLTAHLADYVRQPAYLGKTGGSATTLTGSITVDIPTTLVEGFCATFIPHVDVVSATLQINSFTAYPIKSDPTTAAPLKANKVYTVRKVGTDFLLDSGSAGGGAAIGYETYAYYGENLTDGDSIVGYTYKVYSTRDPFGINYTGRGYGVDSVLDLVAFGLESSPYFVVYKMENQKYVKLPNPTVMPSESVRAVKFSGDGDYVILAGYTKLYVYKISDYTLTNVYSGGLGGTGGQLSVSNTTKGTGGDLFVAVSYGGYYVSAYRIARTSGSVTKLTTSSPLPDRTVNSIKFISNTNFLVACAGGNRSFREYSINTGNNTYSDINSLGPSGVSYYGIAIRPSMDSGIVSYSESGIYKVGRFSVFGGVTSSSFSGVNGFSTTYEIISMFFSKNNDSVFTIAGYQSDNAIGKFEVPKGSFYDVTQADNGFTHGRNYQEICESGSSTAILAAIITPPTGEGGMEENQMAPIVFKGSSFGKFYSSSIIGTALETANASTMSSKKIRVIANA